MKLIVDSGSTKSDLVWLDGRDIVEQKQIDGINPFYQTEEGIEASLDSSCSSPLKECTTEVYFYGAGCVPAKCGIVKEAIKRVFVNAKVEVESDLLGAARALLQHSSGIACILGTGSNSCFFDGEKIIKNVPSLGFILGDEGSGANIGKHLIADILKEYAPQEIRDRFFIEEGVTVAEIMDHVYKQPFPNRYLAQFTKHVFQHEKEDFFRNLLHDCFSQFFERNILPYESYLKGQRTLHCIGSIAWYFREEIQTVAEGYSFSLNVLQAPMQGLIQYHSEG